MAGRKELPPEEKMTRIEPFVKRKQIDLIGKKECETISVLAVNKEYEKRLKNQAK